MATSTWLRSAGPPITGPGATGYVTIANAALTAASFTQFFPAGPDPVWTQALSGTGPSNTVVDASYDNVSLTLAVPEPSSLAIILAAVSALIVTASDTAASPPEPPRDMTMPGHLGSRRQCCDA